MELYIRIVDGQPFEHPILGDNFRHVFPNIDVNNLPPEYARFERFQKPNTAGIFEIEEVSYQWVDGIVKDVWTARPMNDEEKTQKLQDLTNGAYAVVELLKNNAQINATNATSDLNKQMWLDFISELNAWTLTDPENPNIPNPPREKVILRIDTNAT
jgi:hypothetical protein